MAFNTKVFIEALEKDLGVAQDEHEQFEQIVHKNLDLALQQKPKEPLSAYFLFKKDVQADVNAHLKDVDLPEGTKKLSLIAQEIKKRWEALSDLDKLKYQEQAKADRALFKTENPEYKRNTPKKGPKSASVKFSTYAIFCAEVWTPYKNTHKDAKWDDFRKQHYNKDNVDPKLKQRHDDFINWCAKHDQLEGGKELYALFAKEVPFAH